jgi:hypothetical protein
MKVINMFGGPSCGKSVTAWEVTAALKRAGINAEYVPEYAKAMTWEKRFAMLKEQNYIMAKQHRSLSRLRGQVDYAVTDGALLNSIVYADSSVARSFNAMVWEHFNSFDNINFYFPRNPKFTYQVAGRSQSLSEAQEYDRIIREIVPRPGTVFLNTESDYTDQVLRHLDLPGVALPSRRFSKELFTLADSVEADLGAVDAHTGGLHTGNILPPSAADITQAIAIVRYLHEKTVQSAGGTR